jgi:hypothetical protein
VTTDKSGGIIRGVTSVEEDNFTVREVALMGRDI